MRRTDQPFVHGGGSLHGEEFIHERFVNATTKLAQRLGQHKVGLRGIDLILAEAAGIHDGKVRAQAMTDILIGGAQFMLEQFQRQQDTDGHGTSTTRGFFRESRVETLLNGADQRRPGKGVGPLTDRMHDGYKISDLQAGSATAQPMLEIMHKAHRRLSCCEGGSRAAGYDETLSGTSPSERGKKLATTSYAFALV